MRGQLHVGVLVIFNKAVIRSVAPLENPNQSTTVSKHSAPGAF
jgi:hypothetical protein